jgi:Holliday junction resolvasome RuvABC endonuclease subunit
VRILSLDCSSSIGFALFNRGRANPPTLGTWHLPNRFALDDFGARLCAVRDWLAPFVATAAPDVLAFEAPITWVITDRSGAPNSSAGQVRLLVGMVAVVEMVAADAGVRCIEVAVGDAKRALSGTSRAKKRDMATAAVRAGYAIADHHQADAIAVALVAYDHLGVGA